MLNIRSQRWEDTDSVEPPSSHINKMTGCMSALNTETSHPSPRPPQGRVQSAGKKEPQVALMCLDGWTIPTRAPPPTGQLCQFWAGPCCNIYAGRSGCGRVWLQNRQRGGSAARRPLGEMLGNGGMARRTHSQVTSDTFASNVLLPGTKGRKHRWVCVSAVGLWYLPLWWVWTTCSAGGGQLANRTLIWLSVQFLCALRLFLPPPTHPVNGKHHPTHCCTAWQNPSNPGYCGPITLSPSHGRVPFLPTRLRGGGLSTQK